MDRVWYVLSESSLQAPPSSTGCEILFNSSRIDDPTSTAELTSQCKAVQATTGLATLLPLNFLQLFFRLDTLSQLSYPSVLLSVLYGGQSVSSHTVSAQNSKLIFHQSRESFHGYITSEQFNDKVGFFLYGQENSILKCVLCFSTV